MEELSVEGFLPTVLEALDLTQHSLTPTKSKTKKSNV